MTKHSDITTRALVISLKAYAGKTTLEVARLTGLLASQVNWLYAWAIERGFDPILRPIDIKDAYLEDTPQPWPALPTDLRKQGFNCSQATT